jgi:tetratricopeptide (TPR) repeat protein
LVTDNVSVGLVAARYLNAQGYAVSTAPDQESALLKFLDVPPPDIVVLDELGAPQSCVTALSFIRQVPVVGDVPVLIGVQSEWDRPTEQFAERLGGVIFIHEPFSNMSRLHGQIRHILAAQAVADAADEVLDGLFGEPDEPLDPAEDEDAIVDLPPAALVDGPPGFAGDEPVIAKASQEARPVTKAEPVPSGGDEAASPQRSSPRAVRNETIFPAAAPSAESDTENWVLTRRKVRTRGSLAEVGIAELLCRCFDAQFDGVLVVTWGNVAKRVFVRRGVPVYVESDQSAERLGAFLHRIGRLSDDQYEFLRAETVRTGRKQGELLLQQGWISPHELFQLLAEQVTEKILACFAWQDGGYQLIQGQRPGADVVPLKLHFARLVLDGIARHYTEPHLAPYFPDWPDMKAYPRSHGRLSLEQLQLTTTEARLWDLARRGSSMGELERHAAGGRLEVRRLFGGLFLLEWLGFERISAVVPERTPAPSRQAPQPSKPQSPSTRTPVPSSVPASPPSSMILAQERELLEELERLADADYFTLLGLERDAPVAAVHKAFRVLAKRHHPDKLLRYSLSVQTKGADHYRRLVAAYQELADPKRRAAYFDELQGRSDKQSVAAVGPGRRAVLPGQTPFPVMTREALMRSVPQWILEKNYDRAVRQLKAVRDVEPDDAQYTAWLGWALFLKSPETNRREAEKLLADARKAAPDHPDPLLLIGRLREWDGAYHKALDFYTKAAEKNPYDVNLAREARLLEMRLRKGKMKKRDASAPTEEDSNRGMLDQDVSAIFRKMFGKK